VDQHQAAGYPKFRWFVMAILIIGAASSAMIMIAPAPLIGEVSHYLDRELGLVTGLVMAIWTVALVFGGLASGLLSRRLSLPSMFLIAGAMQFLSGALIPVVGPSLPIITVLRVMGGFGTGIITATVPLLVATWFPPYERPYLAGIGTISMACGVLIGIGTSPVIYTKIQSWPMTMVLVSIPMLVFLILSVIMLVAEKKSKRLRDLVAEAHASPHKAKSDLRLALKEPTVYVLCAYVFLFNWVLQGINDLTPGYFAVPPPVGLGFGPVAAGAIMVVFQIFYIIGGAASGVFYHYVFKGNSRRQLMTGFFLAAIYFFIRFSGVTGHGPNLLLFCVLAIAAFGEGQIIPTVEAFIARFYPKHVTGAVGGIVVGIGLSGGAIGVAAGSAALTSTHSYQVSIIIVTVIAIVGLFAALALKKPRAFERTEEQPVRVEAEGALGVNGNETALSGG
jgi:MFS family permease